ncbi:hypothetical protein ACFQZF_05490 [Flavobacterium myungsuense]|uniref:hypothetical protein n=1 Tax=Flavobacterium myungsuense TaxID=651823 RepID=UPI003638766A
MRPLFKFILLFFLPFFALQSCEDFDDVATPEELKVNDFIWKGLNLYYLWQADVPNLSDSRFQYQKDLNSFLYSYSNPSDLFQNLLNKPVSKFPKSDAIDRFSFITSDYSLLEGFFLELQKTMGFHIALSIKTKTKMLLLALLNMFYLIQMLQTKTLNVAIFFML